MGAIFYSWQSDAPNKTNRYFLKECLKNAIKCLNKEEDITEPLRIDQDSTGVPGMPDIASTIFDKINNCDVFVADLTFIGESTNGKKLPNPNVLIELGYAISKLSDRRVVAIMNTSFGMPDDLPFDLKHKRHPIKYCLNETDLQDTNKFKSIKEQLVMELVNAIKLIISTNEDLSSLKESIEPISSSLVYLNKKIESSDSITDWEYVDSNWGGYYIYRNDVRLSMSIKYNEDGIQNSNFIEKWANCFTDERATGYWVDIRYGATIIKRTILVSVDGGRAMSPIPSVFDENNKLLIVNLLDYRIAEIFDTPMNNLSKYFAISGLKLEC